ncbi:MAG: hypothetical protein MUF77_03350 [Leptospira sp.]|jgi:hypothetical protein|nr:hypothetical protein [Leptospira sp.]
MKSEKASSIYIISENLQQIVNAIPVVLSGWIHLLKRIALALYSYWNTKIFFDKMFFIFLFLQLIGSLSPWFYYNIQFLENNEKIYLGPKLNAVFVLFSLLNFFFLGFWKAAWTRIWFFSTQLLSTVLVVWGYLDPNRFFYEFVNSNELHYTPMFFFFLVFLILSFVFGYLTFQEEDRVFS